MITIAFYLSCCSIRGTSQAIYQYARYNEEILKNKSIIVCQDSILNPYRKQIMDKFVDRFPFFVFINLEDMDEILKEQKVDITYLLKSGNIDRVLPKSTFNIVHCVFTCVEDFRHGDIYLPISQSVGGNDCYRYLPKQKYIGPVLPHIVEKLPAPTEDLRDKLGIPKDSRIFGRHGGYETFDLDVVRRVVYKVAKSHPEIYFFFLNTNFFTELPNVVNFEATISDQDKSNFIHSCDAMIYGRKAGESFGLAIAEFSVCNKPIILTKDVPYIGHDAHITFLGDKGIYFSTEDELENILINFEIKDDNYDCYSDRFSPENVMKQFDNLAIQPYLSNITK